MTSYCFSASSPISAKVLAVACFICASACLCGQSFEPPWFLLLLWRNQLRVGRRRSFEPSWDIQTLGRLFSSLLLWVSFAWLWCGCCIVAIEICPVAAMPPWLRDNEGSSIAQMVIRWFLSRWVLTGRTSSICCTPNLFLQLRCAISGQVHLWFDTNHVVSAHLKSVISSRCSQPCSLGCEIRRWCCRLWRVGEGWWWFHRFGRG